MAQEFYHLVKKAKRGDIIRLEDGTEIWIEEQVSGSWFHIHLKLPEGKKFEFIKVVRENNEQKE